MDLPIATRLRLSLRAIIALALLLAPTVGWIRPALAQGTVRERFGDWQLRCDTPAGASAEQCILYQNIADDQRADVNIVVVVIKVSDPATKDDKGQPVRKSVLRVIAPLGVLLPRGLGLKVDDKEIGSTGFVRCLPNGCVAEVELDQQLVGELAKGKTATFIIFQTENEGRGLPLNLAGFEQGLAKLQ